MLATIPQSPFFAAGMLALCACSCLAQTVWLVPPVHTHACTARTFGEATTSREGVPSNKGWFCGGRSEGHGMVAHYHGGGHCIGTGLGMTLLGIS